MIVGGLILSDFLVLQIVSAVAGNDEQCEDLSLTISVIFYLTFTSTDLSDMDLLFENSSLDTLYYSLM